MWMTHRLLLNSNRHLIGLAVLAILAMPVAVATQAVAATPICGNNVKEPGEDCDGGDYGATHCATWSDRFSGGALACSPNCTFDFSSCMPVSAAKEDSTSASTEAKKESGDSGSGGTLTPTGGKKGSSGGQGGGDLTLPSGQTTK